MSKSNDKNQQRPTVTTRLLYPQEEVALLLGTKARAVGHAISCQSLRSTRLGKRQLIHIQEVQKYVESNQPVFPASEHEANHVTRADGDPYPLFEDQESSEASANATSTGTREQHASESVCAAPSNGQDAEFLSLPQVAARWQCSPNMARRHLAVEDLKGVDVTPPGGFATMIVPLAVIREFECRRSMSFKGSVPIDPPGKRTKYDMPRPYTIRRPDYLPARLLVPQQEAAILLGVSVRTIGILIASGLLGTTRIGKRQLIHFSELERFARVDHPYIKTEPNYQTSGQVRSKRPKSTPGHSKKVKPFIEGL